MPAFRAGGPGIGLEVQSAGKAITARVLDADPLTPARFYNDWTVQFLDAQGAPLTDVTVQNACAWMYVQHNHGSPAMNVAQLPDASSYKLSALNLFMRGPWSIELALSSARLGGQPTQVTACDKTHPGSDKIVIPVCLSDEPL